MKKYSWSENEGDFIEGQKYEIKYAVEYLQMFKIIRELDKPCHIDPSWPIWGFQSLETPLTQ